MAEIHALNPDDIGLGDLGRRHGYIERQLNRWSEQLRSSQTRPLPVLEQVHSKLTSAIPAQQRTALVHGDFRLDNCIVDSTTIRAVLDWELCTLGDPLADLALLLVYWSQPEDQLRAIPDAPTAAGGFPTRREVLDRYAARSTRDLSELPYYVAFSYWRLACITEGVHARYRAGAMDGREEAADEFRLRVNTLTAAAAQFAAVSQ